MSHCSSDKDNEEGCQYDGYSITFDDDINEDSLGSDRNSQILDQSRERETDILFRCDDKYEEGQHKLSAQACKDLMQLVSAHFSLGLCAMTSLYCLKSYLTKTCAPMKPMRAFVRPSCEDLIANSAADQCSREQCQEATAKSYEFFM